MSIEISIAIYISDLGILTEYNGSVKKFQGENFCNKSIDDYMSWLKKDFRSKNVLKLLVFGTDYNKVEEIYNSFSDFQIAENNNFSFETLERMLLENVDIKKNKVIKVSNNLNEEIFITKKEKQFIRTVKEENFQNEIFVKTANRNFFDVKSKKSKVVSKKKENLNTVAKDEINLSSIFAKKLK